MKIQTTRFGEVELPDEVQIRFPDGILGFPSIESYVLLEHDMENSPFKWLQSCTDPDLAFIVIDPFMLVSDYPIMLDSDTAKMIQTRDVSNCALMAIIKVPDGDPINMTANLKAPLIVNPETRIGRQIILGSQAFSINEPVFPRLNERLENMSQPQSISAA